jgi:hypothetical protein
MQGWPAGMRSLEMSGTHRHVGGYVDAVLAVLRLMAELTSILLRERCVENIVRKSRRAGFDRYQVTDTVARVPQYIDSTVDFLCSACSLSMHSLNDKRSALLSETLQGDIFYPPVTSIISHPRPSSSHPRQKPPLHLLHQAGHSLL